VGAKHGAKAIAEALKVNAVLTTLNLGYNSIGDEGAKAIAEALKVNAVLEKFTQSERLRRSQEICREGKMLAISHSNRELPDIRSRIRSSVL
jgi:hypothetical protein